MPDMDNRRIEYIPLDDLREDPANPKRHAFGSIRDSINRFGYVEPIVRDDRTGYIISGHGRAATLRNLEAAGAAPPDGVHIGDDGRWYAPVSVGWASSTDLEARGALIALNRTTELGGWADATLLELLEDLSAVEPGLEGIGFDSEDLDNLILSMPDEPEEDALEEMGAGAGAGNAVASSTLIFDSAADLRDWNSFLRGTRKTAPEGLSTASRVLHVLRQANLLPGV